MYAATLRVAPVQRGSVGRLTAHNARTKEYAERTAHIDPDRVRDNRVLVGTSAPGKDLQAAIEGVPMARKGKREAEEYVGAELILTARAEFFRNLTPEAFEDWQNHNLTWLRQEFDQAGRGRLVNAVLHLDEKAAHIHALVAPVVQKQRVHPVTKELMAAKSQINYSSIFGDRPEVLAKARKEGRSHLDTQLGRLQTRYAEAMAPCGLVRGRESMRTKEPDVKYVAPRLYRQIKGQIDALEQESAQAQEKLEQVKKEIQQKSLLYTLQLGAMQKLTKELDQAEAKLTKAATELTDIEGLRDGKARILAQTEAWSIAQGKQELARVVRERFEKRRDERKAAAEKTKAGEPEQTHGPQFRR